MLVIWRHGAPPCRLAMRDGQIGVGLGFDAAGIEHWMPIRSVQVSKGLLGVTLITLPSSHVLIVPKKVLRFRDICELITPK